MHAEFVFELLGCSGHILEEYRLLNYSYTGQKRNDIMYINCCTQVMSVTRIFFVPWNFLRHRDLCTHRPLPRMLGRSI